MKYSIYNSLLRITDNSSILYNAMSDKFIILSNQAEKDYQLCNLDILKDKNPILYNQLIETESIVDENIDEVQEVKNRINNKILDDKTYHLHINPTLDCNFRCWYCYEKHQVGSRMNYYVITAVKEHIKHIIPTKPNLEFFSLSFFGGEPLIYFKSIAQPIIEFLEKECNENNIGFKIHFTSNSFLLNGHILHFLKNKNVSFQITLDGNRENHDKTRFNTNNTGSYDRIISNIKSLAKDSHEVILRINYTASNIESIMEITDDFKDLNNDFKPFISVNFQRVWQDKVNKEAQVDDKLRICIEKFLREGFRVTTHKVQNIVNSPCYADKKNHILVNYNGDVYNCTARDFTEKNRTGILKKDGTIVWDKLPITERIKMKFNRAVCHKCRIAPICGGGCLQREIERAEKEGCLYDYNEQAINEKILDRFEFMFITNSRR